jgi:hypothetical protein
MKVFVCLQMALQSTSRPSLVYVFTLRVFVSFLVDRHGNADNRWPGSASHIS